MSLITGHVDSHIRKKRQNHKIMAVDCTITIADPDQSLPMTCICTMAFSESTLYIIQSGFIGGPVYMYC